MVKMKSMSLQLYELFSKGKYTYFAHIDRDRAVFYIGIKQGNKAINRRRISSNKLVRDMVEARHINGGQFFPEPKDLSKHKDS